MNGEPRKTIVMTVEELNISLAATNVAVTNLTTTVSKLGDRFAKYEDDRVAAAKTETAIREDTARKLGFVHGSAWAMLVMLSGIIAMLIWTISTLNHHIEMSWLDQVVQLAKLALGGS